MLTSVIKRFESPALLSHLRTAAHDNQILSESLKSSFLEGNVPITDFIKQYHNLRKEYHWQTNMVEKWDNGRVLGLG